MNRALVSVIVPLYNCENTIRRCMDSLLKQTYTELELIIVDDGSTDHTALIVKEYADMDRRVHYYDYPEKSGVSNARNCGLREATGTYVMFTDGDDDVQPQFIEKMVQAVEQTADCDMAVCAYYREVWGKKFQVDRLEKSGIYTRNEHLVQTLKDPGHHYFGVVWNKIFRLQIIRDNHLSFSPEITLGEDFVFVLQYLESVNRIRVVSNCLYDYCYIQETSLSRKSSKQLCDCIDEMNNREKIYQQYQKTFFITGMNECYNKKMYAYWINFEIRQQYSLKHEYVWNPEDKRIWEMRLSEQREVQEAHKLYSEAERFMLYVQYSIVNTMKQNAKKIIHGILTNQCANGSSI